MAMGRFVAYYRVSTARQGRSGLGLEAQRTAVRQFLDGGKWKLVGEFTEVESGKKDDRPQLAKALHMAKVTGARLVIAKLDRLSRHAAFLFNLRDAGVKWVAVDMPDANETVVGIMAVLAQDERERISARIKAALAETKKRGTKLGNPQGARPLQAWLKQHGYGRAVQGIKRKADTFALDVAPIIADIEASGITSHEGIARELNAREIKNARGGTGSWTAATVSRLRRRLCPAEGAAA
jgi:DNA invertase Pin-like site-specific DNA recombinase